LAIEAGWRDENIAEASQITEDVLGNFNGVRHLNAHESPGTISLAVHRRAIAHVQGISLSADAIDITVTQSLLDEAARIGEEVDNLEVIRLRNRVYWSGYQRKWLSTTAEDRAVSTGES
jgi:hypothetical protein